MIQYNFPSMQPAPVRALLAISPREATSGPIPPPSHKKSSSFTRRIYEHGGPFKDTSLEAATRKKQAHSSHFEKQFGSCDELVSEWDGLLEDIKTIAVEIASSQQVMAKQLSRYYASITVQLALRGYIARQSLRRLKCERVVKAFILFKRYFRKRVRAAHRIRTSYHSYHIRQSFKRIFAMHMAAKVVQRVFRNRKQSRLLNIFVKMLGIFKRLRDHVMLFGVRRAVKRIVSITQPQRYGTPPIIVRFLYKTLRRRRMRMLKGPLGKLSIYILSTLYTDGAFFPTNATIDFIRRKVLNSQQGQTDNSRLVTSKKAMRTSAIRNSPLRVSRTNIGELTRTTPPDSPNTPVFSSAHLPSFFQGAYRPKSIWEVCKLIRDLTYIAKLHPEVLDDSTPPNASVLMTLYSNKYMSSRRLRVKHTNSSGSMSIGTDSTKAIIPLSPPTTLTPKGKGHKKMQKSPSNSSKQANKQTSKGGKPSNTSLLVGIQSSSSKIGPMENLEERTDDTDDDTQSTHTDSSRGSSVVLRMPSEDVSESSKKPGGDSKRSSGSRGQSKTGKLAELKRENSLTKKPLTKTPSGKAHATGAVAPKATANSPSNAPQSTSPSLNSTHNNSNQNSSSSLLVPPMLGDKSSRQASMKRRGESSRSLCDDNPAPTLSKSQGSSSRSMSTDKDGTKEKPALALSVRSNSRLNRLPSRANSSSSVQESSAEYEESANLSSSRVLSRESLPSSPMRDSIEAAMPTIVAEMEKAPVADIVNEVLPEPIAGEVLERHATEKDLSDVRATLDQLIESVVVRDAKDGLASIYKSSPWILQTLVSHEAEGVVEAIVVQTLQSLVDRADQSILTSPGRHTSTREVDEGLDQVKSVGSMTVDVVSSVLESSVDSLVFKITGSPPKPKLRLDTSYSANMESTLSHTFALSDCSTTDYTTDTDTPFKHLKDTLGHIQSQFSNPNSPSKLSREQVHALLPLDSMVQEEVVSQAVSNLLAMQGLSIVVDPFDHLAAGTEHHDMQSFVFIENDEEMDGESVGHVSSVSSVDWDLPDDVINSLLGTD